MIGGCAGAYLVRKEPLILTGKASIGVAAIANANIGYQWTVNAPEKRSAK